MLTLVGTLVKVVPPASTNVRHVVLTFFLQRKKRSVPARQADGRGREGKVGDGRGGK